MNMTVILNSDNKSRTSIEVSHPPKIGDKILLFIDDISPKYVVATDILYISMPDSSYAPKYIYADETTELIF